VRTCPNCFEENPDKAKFCLNCGSSLAGEDAAEERKVVTIVFADLVGFTQQSDHADPEDVKAMLRPRFAGPGGHSAETARSQLAELTVSAALAEADGDLDAALEGYRKLVTRWSSFGVPLETAFAYEGHARVLEALGRSEEAVPERAAASAIKLQLGAA